MRVAFLIDGFNLYHSIGPAERASGKRLKWLDIRSLCATLVSSSMGRGYSLVSVDYFTALAKHLSSTDPGKVRRHRAFIDALKSTGVTTHEANFKGKDHHRPLSAFLLRAFRKPKKGLRLAIDWLWLSWRSYEEKETDVAIACRVLELLGTGAADAVVIVSGDTDLVPAIRTAHKLHPGAEVWVASPYSRWNKVVESAAGKHRSVKLSPALYAAHQLPQTITTPSGSVIAKPRTW